MLCLKGFALFSRFGSCRDRGPGGHLAVLDVAVADPTTRTALAAATPSSRLAGVAAEQRAARKVHKYNALCENVGSHFFPAVIERFGACSDSLIGVIRTLAGVGDRDPLGDHLYTFSASSRVTFLAQRTMCPCRRCHG